MTTKNHIRQTFTQDWCNQQNQIKDNAWLIKGDFDRFKLTNDLYGSLICDYLLDWTLEVVETKLRSYQKRWGREDLLWNFIGDDVTIYIPPSVLREADIAQLLWDIRDAIKKSFYRRYMVGVITLPPVFFDDLSSNVLEILRSEFESMDVVFDFARRQQGYLILFPIGADGVSSESIDAVLRVVQCRTGKPVPPVEMRLDWLCDPDDQTYHEFNEGFLEPPSISFAACSVEMGMDNKSISYDRRSVYEQVSFACQSALKKCKRQREHVLLQKYELGLRDIYSAPQPAGVWALHSPLRWSSERYLREALYFKQLDQPVLFQFNPVYHSASIKFASALNDDIPKIEKYRGNKYGVGLKGINEIFDQITADCLIAELMSVFSKVMHSTLVEKGIPPAGVHIARFVDRFTVCCEQPVLQLPEIIELVRNLATLFNYVSDEIKISHLRTNVVVGEINAVGCHLFHQLALTSLSPRSIFLENSKPPIDVRQNSPVSVLLEGSVTLERNSFMSAKLLDTYLGAISQR